MKRWQIQKKTLYYEEKMREYGCATVAEYKALQAKLRSERGKRNGGKHKPNTPHNIVKLTPEQREELWNNIFELLEEGGLTANLPTIEN